MTDATQQLQHAQGVFNAARELAHLAHRERCVVAARARTSGLSFGAVARALGLSKSNGVRIIAEGKAIIAERSAEGTR